MLLRKAEQTRVIDYLAQNFTLVKANYVQSDGRSIRKEIGADDTVTGFKLASETQPDGSPYYDATVDGFVQANLTSLDINNKTFIVAYRPGTGAPVNGSYILRWASGSTANLLAIVCNGPGFFSAYYVGNTVFNNAASTADDWAVGTDYLLCVTVPSAGETMRFYSNGSQIGSVVLTNNTVVTSVVNSLSGVGAIFSGGANRAQGLVGPLTIVDGVLTANEVAEVYRAWRY